MASCVRAVIIRQVGRRATNPAKGARASAPAETTPRLIPLHYVISQLQNCPSRKKRLPRSTHLEGTAARMAACQSTPARDRPGRRKTCSQERCAPQHNNSCAATPTGRLRDVSLRKKNLLRGRDTWPHASASLTQDAEMRRIGRACSPLTRCTCRCASCAWPIQPGYHPSGQRNSWSSNLSKILRLHPHIG